MSVKAKESAQIQKARKKIKKQLAESHKHVSGTALDEMRKIIQRQLLRRPDRINLKSKEFTLFDENQHPAKTESKFVHKLLNQLKHKHGKSPAMKPLEGRVIVPK